MNNAREGKSERGRRKVSGGFRKEGLISQNLGGQQKQKTVVFLLAKGAKDPGPARSPIPHLQEGATNT